jgi:hypothetical protein
VTSRQVGHTTTETVALDAGCATFQNNTFLRMVTARTRKDLTRCFVFRRHNAVADCNGLGERSKGGRGTRACSTRSRYLGDVSRSSSLSAGTRLPFTHGRQKSRRRSSKYCFTDVLECNDDAGNGNSYFLLSEGEARRSKTIATMRGRYTAGAKCAYRKCNKRVLT